MALQLLQGPFTVDTYHRLAELGILDEDDRVELLDGQVVEMTPIGPQHAGCVGALTKLLGGLVGPRTLWVQNPVHLGPHAELQPDVAVLQNAPGAYRQAHPRAVDVLLVIEVADTSLERDRELKLPRYAAAGIPEAWLVDLDREAIQVYREPGHDGYREVATVRRGDRLRPDCLGGAELQVSDILG